MEPAEEVSISNIVLEKMIQANEPERYLKLTMKDL